MSLPKPQPGYVLAKDVDQQTIGNLVLANEDKERESVIAKAILCGDNLTENLPSSVVVNVCPVKVGQTFYYKKYYRYWYPDKRLIKNFLFRLRF